MQIPPESKTIAWIIGNAATLLNLGTVGSYGKVPSNGGEVADTTWAEWCRVDPLTDRTKAEDRMESGMFVGFRLKSGEHVLSEARIVGTIRRRLVSGSWPGDRQEAAVRPNWRAA